MTWLAATWLRQGYDTGFKKAARPERKVNTELMVKGNVSSCEMVIWTFGPENVVYSPRDASTPDPEGTSHRSKETSRPRGTADL